MDAPNEHRRIMIATVVEGQGEVTAEPVLLCRLAAEIALEGSGTIGLTRLNRCTRD